MRKLLLPSLLLAAASALSAQSITTYSDTFTGAQTVRTTNGSGAVDSFEWYSGSNGTPLGTPAWNYTTTGGGSFATTVDRGALGYFTDPGSSAALVNVGDSITVSLDMHYIASGANTGDRFRVGLLQSAANPNATSASGFTSVGGAGANTQARINANWDNNSSTVASNFVNLYQGFLVDRLTAKTSTGTVPANNVSFIERVGGTSANSVVGGTATDGPASLAGFTTIGTGGNTFEIVANGSATNLVNVPLVLTFSLTYQGIDSGSGKKLVDMAYSLTDGTTFTNSYAVTGYMTSDSLTFDTLALYSRAAYATLDNVTITLSSVAAAPVPEPATYALVAGAAMLGLAALRRRRQVAA